MNAPKQLVLWAIFDEDGLAGYEPVMGDGGKGYDLYSNFKTARAYRTEQQQREHRPLELKKVIVVYE